MFEPYNTAITLLVYCILLPWKKLMVRMHRFDPLELHERLGLSPPPSRRKLRRIVLHAVSVGEMSSAEPLIRSLPETDFVLTTGNRRGREVAELLEERHANISAVRFLPAEPGRILTRWLRSADPDLLVIMETDFWPNMIAAAAGLEIPVIIVNGRLYRNDPKRYRLAQRFFRRMFSLVDWIGVQSEEDASLFVSIGADLSRIEVVGNLKYGLLESRPEGDRRPQPSPNRQKPLVIAGSTHANEEELILDAFRSARSAGLTARLVLAPRDIERSDAVEENARRKGLTTERWSAHRRLAEDGWDVLILDEVGFLADLYRHAAVAVIGGSFVDHGGHNPIEAARFGVPIIIGPHTHNFRHVVDDFLRAEGIRQVRTMELTSVLTGLLSDRDQASAMGARALAVVESHRSVTRRYVDVIEGMLGHRPKTHERSGRERFMQREPA